MIRFGDGKGVLQARHAACAVEGWRMAVEAAGELWSSSEAEVETLGQEPPEFRLHFRGIGLTWTVRCEAGTADGTFIVGSELENRSDRPIPLGKAFLLDASGPIRIGDGHESLACLPLFGEILSRILFHVGEKDRPRKSKIKFQFYNLRDRIAMQVGFLTFRRANTEVEYEHSAKDGVTRLRAWCDFAGWVLEPGQRTPTETFALMMGDDPHAQLERWAALASRHCAPRKWEDPPIGWVGWSWVDAFTVERYEDVVLRNCAAIRRRLAGFGVNHVWVSIGNIAGGNPGDWLNWNTKLFPGGPRRLASRLGEMGFRWGLWCGVFWICSLLRDRVEELRDALLKNPDGSLMVVRKEWQYGDAGAMSKADRPCIYALDPSHPKALAFLRETFVAYRAWGVRYYMLDFLQAGAGNIGTYPYTDHHDRSLVAGPEAYHHALRVVREAAGDDTYFLSSSGPTVHNAGAVDAIRTGNDFGEGRALYPDSYFYPATFVINSVSYWHGPLMALMNQASAYYTHRKLYINDSGNVLTVDKPIPLSDAQVHATIHAMSGGPSMIGDDVDRMDEERLSLIKKTLPRSREVAFPVDLFDAVAPDHPRIFHRRIEKPWGRFDVLAIYNFTDEVLPVPVLLSRLGLKDDADHLVWEFWNAEYLGRTRGTFHARVPPGTVRVYRLVEDTGVPVLLGTDMHLLMGEMEIDACLWDPAALTLSGTAIRPTGEKGNVFFHAPPTLRVANPRGHWIAKDAGENCLIVRAALGFDDGVADFSLRFAPLSAPLDVPQLNLT